MIFFSGRSFLVVIGLFVIALASNEFIPKEETMKERFRYLADFYLNNFGSYPPSDTGSCFSPGFCPGLYDYFGFDQRHNAEFFEAFFDPRNEEYFDKMFGFDASMFRDTPTTNCDSSAPSSKMENPSMTKAREEYFSKLEVCRKMVFDTNVKKSFFWKNLSDHDKEVYDLSAELRNDNILAISNGPRPKSVMALEKIRKHYPDTKFDAVISQVMSEHKELIAIGCAVIKEGEIHLHWHRNMRVYAFSYSRSSPMVIVRQKRGKPASAVPIQKVEKPAAAVQIQRMEKPASAVPIQKMEKFASVVPIKSPWDFVVIAHHPLDHKYVNDLNDGLHKVKNEAEFLEFKNRVLSQWSYDGRALVSFLKSQ